MDSLNEIEISTTVYQSFKMKVSFIKNEFHGLPLATGYILNLKYSFVLFWQLEHLSFMGLKIISP